VLLEPNNETELATRPRIEQELRLLITITHEIAAAGDFRSSVEIALRRICESTGWVFGEVWVPNTEGTALEYGDAWYKQPEGLDRFRDFSRQIRLSPGVGLPGRVWVSKHPEWVRDISTIASPRARILVDAGLKGALGVPIIGDGQVLCVLIFFMREAREEDSELVEIVSAIANQLGVVVKQKRMEQALRQVRADLESRVEGRTRDLAQANQALQAEIAERRRVQETLSVRAQQQAGVVRIGQLALSGKDISALFDEACALVAHTLGVELCGLLEVLPGGEALRLRSGVGWQEGMVGHATVSSGFNCQAGYTLVSAAPVIAEDLQTETRFKGAPLLLDHGVISGMSVVISGRDRPFGVLAAYATKRRSFNTNDIHFLEAVANVLSDALERKRTEEEIRRSDAWLRSLIDTTQDAVLSIDRQGHIVLFNPSAEQIFGYQREEVIGQKVNVLMGEPYASEHDGYIERYERTGVPHAIGRIRSVTARRKTGELFPIELSVTKIAEDTHVQYAAFIRDISEKSRLQAQVVESERLAAIGTTAAKIGHELGNPLNGMSLTVQLLEQRLNRQSAEPDKQVSATVRRLKNEISRLNQLVGQFRTISRREKYEFQPTQLAELIDEIVKIQAPHLAQSGIRVTSRVAQNLPLLNLDTDKLKQTFLNLIKNAVEAMPAGGTITIEADVADSDVVLEIRDTGSGIPLDVDAFEPFVTTKREGTGIGLVIVRQIIVAHGGSISYQSRPNEGTTFRIRLPVP
jgi:PAS domain S-box-containing protein